MEGKREEKRIARLAPTLHSILKSAQRDSKIHCQDIGQCQTSAGESLFLSPPTFFLISELYYLLPQTVEQTGGMAEEYN